MFQAQGARLKVKWNASHEREYVPPPDRRLDMHAPVNFYCVYDTDGLRFAAVQPPAGVVAYYETTELTGRSGRLGLVVRDQNFQAKFSNVCVVPLD